MKKKQQSMWTKDLTPGFVRVMTTDISPDFSGDLWTKDITHHIVGTLAVFGLVVSAFVATLGVATVSVNVELALAQQAAASQTASLMLAEENHPLMPMANGSSTGQRPPKMDDRMGSSTMGSTTKPSIDVARAMFCPKIERVIGRGNRQATTTGEIGQLQQFIANHFNLNPKDVVTGYFGSTTEGYLKKFQQEQGIAPAPTVGPLTRAAIARLCNPSGKDPVTTKGDEMREGKGAMGSSTMSTSTRPVPPMPPKQEHQQEHQEGSMPGTHSTSTNTNTNAASSSVTVQVVSPNGGENYHAGSGDTLTVSWVATGVPQGARACVTLISQSDKHFAFPHKGERCVAAANGTGSVSGPLELTREYMLTAGSYTAQVTIIPSTGTVNGILAQDSSNGTFTLDNEELGLSQNTSNSASLIEAVAQISDGYGKLLDAALGLLGL